MVSVNSSGIEERNGVLAGLLVLVADDNPLNLKVAGKFLEYWGVTIHTAATGGEAVQKVQQHTYSLVLMDLRMPYMDGYEAARQIRLQPQNAGLLMIALTADITPDIREKVLEAGMNDLIIKPFTPDELFNILLQCKDNAPAGPPASQTIEP